MKYTHLYKFIGCLLIAIMLVSCTKKTPSYLIGGSGWGKIVEVLKGERVWSHQLEPKQECNSVCFVGKNKILYSFKQGVKLIDREHKVLWEYICHKDSEIHSASLTKNDNFLIGECGHPAKIYEFTPKGEKLLEIDFETGVKNPHGQFRKVYKTVEGTYLVPVLGKSCILEIDVKGQIIREVKTDFSVFSIEILQNGNWLLSCGDSHRLEEMNPQTKEIVWRLSENDIENLPLRFVAETVRLKNGNTIICNWGGHAKGDSKTAQVFEIDQNNKLIWKIEDYQQFGNVSTIDLLEKQ
jgi:WD40 repeat protein